MLFFSFNFEWSPRPKIHLLIVSILCICSAITALILYKNTNDELLASDIVTGVVIESNFTDKGMHTPVVEYHGRNGDVLSFESRFSSSPQKYFKGDRVEVVLYKDGKKPEIKNFITIYGLPAFAAVFSFISLIGSIAVYYLRVKPLSR